MKRIIKTVFMIFFICVSSVPIVVFAGTADNELITDGAYVQMGTYYGEPILWRCISTNADDDNGKLILSDRIICYKCFDSLINELDYSNYQNRYGSPYWEESNIRVWLNSTQFGGNVAWPRNNPPDNVANPYSDEDGFLSSTNFTSTELSAMKSVSQWQILSLDKANEVTNGYLYFFETNGRSKTVSPTLGPLYDPYARYQSISALSHVEGGMKKIVDTMFLINEPQVYNLYMKYDALATPTDKALEGWATQNEFWANTPNKYWLRTTSDDCRVNTVTDSNGYGENFPYLGDVCGIRPAFYLNEDNVRVISGDGQWYDPYIIDGCGESGTTVFSMSREVPLSTETIIDGETILVPMKEIYESLGAEVAFDQESQIVTAYNDYTTVIMEIGNNEMGNGVEVVNLDSAPQIINGVIMVSLDAVNNSFDANTEYIEELNRIVIDIPQEQVFSDEVGLEKWQRQRDTLRIKR